MSTATEIEDQAPDVDQAPAPEPEHVEPSPSRPRSRARKPRTRTEKTPRQPGASRSSSTRRAPLAPRVANAHMMIGLGVSFAPGIPNGQAIGIALATQAETIGEAWEALAKENPRVREMLEKLLTAGAVGQLLMAYMPVALAAAGRSDLLGQLGNLAASVAPDLHAVPDPAAT